MQPGRYATQVSIHDYSQVAVTVRKRFIPLVLAGAPLGREPASARAARRTASNCRRTRPRWTTAARLQQLMLGAPARTDLPLSSGIVEIISTVELAVTAVYTAGTGAIDVETIMARRLP